MRLDMDRDWWGSAFGAIRMKSGKFSPNWITVGTTSALTDTHSLLRRVMTAPDFECGAPGDEKADH